MRSSRMTGHLCLSYNTVPQRDELDLPQCRQGAPVLKCSPAGIDAAVTCSDAGGVSGDQPTDSLTSITLTYQAAR